MKPIPAVIVMAEKQRDKVKRLYDYCLALDGTRLAVVDAGKEINATRSRFDAAHLAVRKACDTFRRTPFLWMEPDSIPLKPGWKAQLEAQYRNAGQPFMLPDLTGLSRFDVASGIGIYPAGARNIIPRQKPLAPFLQWDHYLYVRKRRMIKFTRLIQHSYAVYDESGGIVRRHAFPLDASMLRHDAVMFHADPNQSILLNFEIEAAFAPHCQAA